MNASLSLESILEMLKGLSLSNRKWLAEHLIEPRENESLLQAQDNERAVRRASDEAFVREFLAMPRGNDLTADEMKQMIRESHYFDNSKVKYKYADEE